jgi:hypothetical protein
MAKYSKLSPYADTKTFDKFLDIWTPRPITKYASDKLYTLAQKYNLRPDLLSYDLYQTPKLWWVFAMRNPNTLKNPLIDFVTGVTIYLPSLTVLRKELNF